MKRIDYSWGSGTATIFLHLNEGQVYNMGMKDQVVLLEKYPGSKTYYSSRSGMSGAGFLLVPNNEIFISLPVYRDGIKYLSEAYLTEVNGTTLMVPTSLQNETQRNWRNPGVARVNEKLLFIFSNEDLLRVLKNENIPSEEEMKNFSYKYLTTGSRGGVQRFSSERFTATKLCEVVENQIGCKYSLFGREYLTTHREIKEYLPYPLADFHRIFFPREWKEACERQALIFEQNGDTERVESPLECKLHVQRGVNSAYSFKRDGFLSEVIHIVDYYDRFTETPYDWRNGWSTIRGMAWKIREDQVFAIFCDEKKNFSPRFSEMEGWEEYEIQTSIFEWVQKTPQEWRDEMQKNAHTKLNSEYLSALRWRVTSEKSKEKVRELLTFNTETPIFVADSLATGNCEYGTGQFMTQFNLEEGVICAELLAHPKIEEILENKRFRVTILQKFGGSVEGEGRVNSSRRRRGSTIIIEDDELLDEE